MRYKDLGFGDASKEYRKIGTEPEVILVAEKGRRLAYCGDPRDHRSDRNGFRRQPSNLSANTSSMIYEKGC